MAASGTGVVVNARSITVLSLLSAAYLVFSSLLLGFKADDVVLIAIVNVCFYLSPGTRKFILGFSIFAVYWIIFDSMKAFPNYIFFPVHMADFYNFDKGLFGIHYQGKVLSINEYWLANHIPALDALGGLFYLCWVPVPMGFAAYLFFTRKRQFLYFALTFFLVNLLGFVVYYTFPVAPPWYIQEHGFHFIANTPGGIGGLARFDHMFNVSVFKSIYAKGSNVFAAMPSLHSAFPVIVIYYAFRNRLRWVSIAFFMLVAIGIWFTAVYASHHYVVDVLSGIVCAIAAISLFNFIAGLKPVELLLNKYETIIS